MNVINFACYGLFFKLLRCGTQRIEKNLGQKRANKDFNSNFILFFNVNEHEQNVYF